MTWIDEFSHLKIKTEKRGTYLKHQTGRRPVLNV